MHLTCNIPVDKQNELNIKNNNNVNATKKLTVNL